MVQVLSRCIVVLLQPCRAGEYDVSMVYERAWLTFWVNFWDAGCRNVVDGLWWYDMLL